MRRISELANIFSKLPTFTNFVSGRCKAARKEVYCDDNCSHCLQLMRTYWQFHQTVTSAILI